MAFIYCSENVLSRHSLVITMTNAKVIGWVVLCPACGDITEYNFDPVGCELRCSVCGEQLEIQPTKRPVKGQDGLYRNIQARDRPLQMEGDSDGLYWQIKVRDKP